MTPKPTCQHLAHVQVGPARPFTGPVGRGETPAAHGNITITVECRACGARRSENVNGRHVELGDWGPNRQTRQERAARATRAAEIAVSAVEPAEIDGLRLSLDPDGYVRVTGRPHDDGEAAAAMQAWSSFDAALRARQLVLAAQEAARAV